jgi:hypothetical protein
VRIRLLTTLALFLLGGATPLHASLDPAPQCLPLASPGAEPAGIKSALTAAVIPNYDAEDRDYMIRTIVFEASGEPRRERSRSPMSFLIASKAADGVPVLRTW